MQINAQYIYICVCLHTRSVNVLQNYLIMTEFKYIYKRFIIVEFAKIPFQYSAFTSDAIGCCEKISALLIYINLHAKIQHEKKQRHPIFVFFLAF